MECRTEDEVRAEARIILGLDNSDTDAISGTGQITTFNQLGFDKIKDKPDGWYFPYNLNEPCIILETKSELEDISKQKWMDELKKNCDIAHNKYPKVVGILYNGKEVKCLKNNVWIEDIPKELQGKQFYLDLFTPQGIDKETIYSITQKINNCLHSEFGIRNLYHRMIFTACALVAKRYGAFLSEGMGYSNFHQSILSTLQKELYKDKHQNMKLDTLTEVYSEIKMNLNVNSEDEKEQEHVRKLIADFIGWVEEISDCINSNEWNGEDVMGIFFNEFNRYKTKSEAGQVFTPDHITNFMYYLIGCNQNDNILDACCGSGAFLVKAMSNMIQEAGGVNTQKAIQIKQEQLYGIEYDRQIYALACANMLIHKDGKTNLEAMDTRTEAAAYWIRSKPITKVLMNPPYETKYGCLEIVFNVLNSVNMGTQCAFILPDKKFEKGSKRLVKDILDNHKITKIIKLPKDLFFGVGVETSIFIFEAGIPQKDSEIFTYYIEDDGLVVVKNKGRHDIKNRWPAIEQQALDDISKLRNGEWIKPSEHLSYQMPEKPFEIYEEDFQKTALKYLLFKEGLGGVSELSDKVADAVLYSSDISENEDDVIIRIKKNAN